MALLDVASSQLSELHFKALLSLWASSINVPLGDHPCHCDCDLHKVFRKMASVHWLFLDDYQSLSEIQDSLTVEAIRFR